MAWQNSIDAAENECTRMYAKERGRIRRDGACCEYSCLLSNLFRRTHIARTQKERDGTAQQHFFMYRGRVVEPRGCREGGGRRQTPGRTMSDEIEELTESPSSKARMCVPSSSFAGPITKCIDDVLISALVLNHIFTTCHKRQ